MSYQKETQDKELPLLDHIRELLTRLKRVIMILAFFFILYFTFGITFIQLGPYRVPIPYPSLYHSIAVLFVRDFIDREIPPGLKPITINTLDPIFSGLSVAAYLAIFSASPFIAREFWAFVAPGLYEHEKKFVRKTIIPAVLLFAAGSAFAYFIILPFMFLFVYRYDLALNIDPTLSFKSIVSTILLLMTATGVAFELPLVMAGMTKLGLVKPHTWLKNWRWGVMISFIIAWIISPGTTGGLIETTIGIILSGLYFAGTAVSYFIARKNNSKKVITT
ncbi:twin-arginine translocase subunit TatC [Stygiolobus caldivivus]|uniref:Sec-independent protein translocase protein TatC n=1 Tax=Stygiolobus caldivivus TaxID=2824673 RepID=A0A8D5U739_9CREN|nr:twin-arginine translocase subunit TatC [Stygiolobus caldivivus]BCU70437.1 twin-arginine translocase subunit TatC [Stygiolobus caldivivus]